jgi:hypothetical protein
MSKDVEHDPTNPLMPGLMWRIHELLDEVHTARVEWDSLGVEAVIGELGEMATALTETASDLRRLADRHEAAMPRLLRALQDVAAGLQSLEQRLPPQAPGATHPAES